MLHCYSYRTALPNVGLATSSVLAEHGPSPEAFSLMSTTARHPC